MQTEIILNYFEHAVICCDFQCENCELEHAAARFKAPCVQQQTTFTEHKVYPRSK